MAEFVNDVLDLDGHHFGEVPITNVKILQRHLAIWANMFSVEGNDFIGLLCRNDGAAVAAMPKTTTAVVTLRRSVSFERLFRGRRRGTEITFIDLALLITLLRFETMVFRAQAFDLFLQLDALRAVGACQAETFFSQGIFHTAWQR